MPTNPPSPELIEPYADAAAALLGVVITPLCRPGVIANLMRIIELGQEVMSVPLPDPIPLAPEFEP